MFVLLNVYGHNSNCFYVVYKEKFNCFEDAKKEMEGQVEDAMMNHYSEAEEEDEKFSIVREDKYNVHIFTKDAQDWWMIVEV